MNEYGNYSEYNDETQSVPWRRVVLILLSIVLIVVIVLFALRECSGGSKNLESDLLTAGKDYYRLYVNQLPSAPGQCQTVSLDQLTNSGLITNKDQFSTCSGTSTYVKVCKLESGTYHYTALLSCDDYVSNYGSWMDGAEINLVTDSSDVRFSFLGEVLKKGNSSGGTSTGGTTTKSYYAGYHTSAPASGYIRDDSSATTAYRWYKTTTATSTQEYWNNKAYSSTEPSGYPNKGASKSETKTSTTKPTASSYLTDIKEITEYRSQQVARPYRYMCADPDIPGTIYSYTVCERRDAPTHKYTVAIYYTCTGYSDTKKGTECSPMTEWSSENKCESSTLNGINCETRKSYSYKVTSWQWYKNTTVGSSTRSYYTGYYTSAPASGYVRDDSSKTTAYRYYKNVTSGGSTSGGSSTSDEWEPVTTGYVTELELITTFQSLGYEVQSLYDIYNHEEIRYQIKLQYRNKIEE